MGFIAVLVALLWLTEVVFLNQFYQNVKTTQIKNLTDEIADNLSNSNLEASLDTLSDHTNYCVRIIDLNNQTIYENSQNAGVCGYVPANSREISQLYKEALENGGRTTHSVKDNTSNSFSDYLFNKEDQGAVLESITVAEIGYVEGEPFLLMVSGRISVISEISDTLSIIVILISSVLIGISLILAFLLAKHIAKPIKKINDSAKQLANNNFEITFEGKGYLEIEELNDTLNYAKTNLAKVEQLRNELVANMTHDIRTPLTMISGYAEMMREIPGENKPENIQVIIDECTRLSTLINDVLVLSKLQSNNEPLQISHFNLTQTLHDIVNRVKILLHDDSYDISFAYEKIVYVDADSVKMNQVIYNLLLNAIHYSEDNKKIIVKQSVQDGKVRIEIIDSGKGIKPEDLNHVFNRYYQTRDRTRGGSGLGLSIVKGVLELHEAVYGVHSVVQKGSTFYFELNVSNEENTSSKV